MLYSEFLNETGAPQSAETYDQYREIEAIYMSRENMTKIEAYKLWKRRHGEKINKPRAKELREIKDAIRDFKGNREYAKREEENIVHKYAEKMAEYDSKNWIDRSVIESLERQQNDEIYRLYENYGNDATIHIIYADGSQCIASGTEIVGGEITPKMQHIAYAHYQDGWTEYDTLTGNLDDVWDMEKDEDIEASEQYYSDVEIKFGTAWGMKHKTA